MCLYCSLYAYYLYILLQKLSLVKITQNKAGYTATLVACGWAEAVLEKVISVFGQEKWAQKAQKRRKSKKGTDQPTD